MTIALIVAMAENGVIGKNNALPWHLPEDLKYFKATTMAKPIIMGRKTYESIGRPLPGRTNIVLTRDETCLFPESVRRVADLAEAVKLAEAIAKEGGADEVMVIGGQQIYQLFMPIAERLYLTKVHASVDGDAYLTGINENEWHLLSEELHDANDINPYPYSFCVYERKHY